MFVPSGSKEASREYLIFNLIFVVPVRLINIFRKRKMGFLVILLERFSWTIFLSLVFISVLSVWILLLKR